jgi:hypothetical protein
MACGSCGGSVKVIHQVRRPDGTVKRYATSAEAKAAASKTGYEYTEIRR